MAKVRWSLAAPPGVQFTMPSIGGRPKMSAPTIEIELDDPALGGTAFQEIYAQLQKQLGSGATAAASGQPQSRSTQPQPPNHNPVKVQGPQQPRGVGPRPATPNGQPAPIPTQPPTASRPASAANDAAMKAMAALQAKVEEALSLAARVNALEALTTDAQARLTEVEAAVNAMIAAGPGGALPTPTEPAPAEEAPPPAGG